MTILASWPSKAAAYMIKAVTLFSLRSMTFHNFQVPWIKWSSTGEEIKNTWNSSAEVWHHNTPSHAAITSIGHSGSKCDSRFNLLGIYKSLQQVDDKNDIQIEKECTWRFIWFDQSTYIYKSFHSSTNTRYALEIEFNTIKSRKELSYTTTLNIYWEQPPILS